MNRGRQSAQPPSRRWSNTVIWGKSRPPCQGADLSWLGFFVGPVPATPHTPAQPLSTAWTPLMHTRAYAEAGVGVMCTSTRWRRPPLSARDKRQHIEGRCSTPALGGPNRPSFCSEASRYSSSPRPTPAVGGRATSMVPQAQHLPTCAASTSAPWSSALHIEC